MWFPKFALVFVLLASTAGFADGLCGDISDTVHFPAYRLQAIAEDGSSLPEVPVSVEIRTSEANWEGDHWGDIFHSLEVGISFDKANGIYTSQAVDVEAPSHIKGVHFDCRDHFASFRVKFNSPPKDEKGFMVDRSYDVFQYTFPGEGKSYQLPDSSVVHKMQLKKLEAVSGRFSDAGHIIGASGQIVSATWESQPSYGGVVDRTSIGLTPEEIQLINQSIANSTPVVAYGLRGEDNVLWIQNISAPTAK